MIAVEFNPEKLEGVDETWWQGWLRKANEASELARQEVEAGKEVNFQDVVWSELKHWLLEKVFHGKCAYCESETEVSGYAAADHYRPKGRVAGDVDHGGYYWVAYEWRNLVPCCNRCNTGAKRDFFPIAGRRVCNPMDASCTIDLNRIEAPLLLSPYEDGDANPRKHLKFTKFGHIIPRNESARGQSSITVCGLDRTQLKNKRRKNQESAWLKWLSLHVLEVPEIELRAFRQKIECGCIEHSAAVADAICEKWEESFKEIPGANFD